MIWINDVEMEDISLPDAYDLAIEQSKNQEYISLIYREGNVRVKWNMYDGEIFRVRVAPKWEVHDE